MSRALVAAAVITQGFDLVTYLAAGASAPYLEAGVLAGVSPGIVTIAKVAGVLLALLIASFLRPPEWQRGALAFVIAVGAFGAGANLATLVA